MREMTRGKFIVKSSNITLLGTIGEGKAHSLKRLKISMCFCSFIGEFGIVYRARQGNSSKVVAVKTLKGLLTYLYECTFRPKMGLKNLMWLHIFVGHFNQVEVDRFVEESLKMSRFKHSHVMGLIGVCLDAGSAPFIIMPFMANGSLLKYLKRERDNLVLSEEKDLDEVYFYK